MQLSKEFEGITDGMGIDYKVREGSLADALDEKKLASMLLRFAEENETASYQQQTVTALRQLVFKSNEIVDLLRQLVNRKPWYVRLYERIKQWAGRNR